MKLIPLTQGLFAQVDDSDYEPLACHKWYAKRSPNLVYAARNCRVDGKRKTILMHKVIMCPTATQVIDHIDSDGLNNQRSNLRACSQGENMFNRRPQRNSSSIYKGVSKIKVKVMDRGKLYEYTRYASQIIKDRKHYHLGNFKTELEAAAAYNRKAIELHGEFAKLNIIES